ncbi:hypothetical protein C8R46DRAFT_1227997 [Mycena filopes]|nr:hypothetical protein C8R46DRAFT_1227997 [Mycena filopes]
MEFLIDTLLGQLEENPHNPKEWHRLVRIAESGGDIPLLRRVYEALLEQYPNTAPVQIAYLKLFATAATTLPVQELINRFLPLSPSFELWAFYLGYIRRTNPPSLPSSRDNVRRAYEFSVTRIGHDPQSGPMWAEYLRFLHTGEVTSWWEASQKTDMLRSTYQRCMAVDEIAGERFLRDLRPAHMQARIVLRELAGHIAGLGINCTQSSLPLPHPATFSRQEIELIGRWKAYLKWEEGNPLAIQEDLLNVRIQTVYRKAVIWMRYYPEIWFRAFSWTASVGGPDEGLLILQAGLDANPDSFALTYAYAEALEEAQLDTGTRDFSAIHRVYERFLGVLRDQLTHARRETPQQELADLKKQYTNAWINYMRFTGRTEGHKACHDAFQSMHTGNDEYIGWELYEWAAITRYRCQCAEGGQTAAVRIFETGMERYESNATYIVSYLGFLLTVNAKNDARDLFDRIIRTFTAQEAKPIWEHWARSHCEHDDLKARLDFERRMAEIYPDGGFEPEPLLKRFARRHAYFSLDAIADHDLAFAKTGYPNYQQV